MGILGPERYEKAENYDSAFLFMKTVTFVKTFAAWI
jgi:hypothetical protein